MSTLPVISPYYDVTASHAAANDSGQVPVVVRRRPNLMQGHALEILGHAIEYLVDSRVVNPNGNRVEYNREAVALLSRSSREIFDSCEQIVPFSDRLKHWLYGPSRRAA